MIPESVKIVTEVYDVYGYAAGEYSVTFPIVADELEFDENGLFRTGFWEGEDGEFRIRVIQRGDDGVLTGMVYKAPKQP